MYGVQCATKLYDIRRTLGGLPPFRRFLLIDRPQGKNRFTFTLSQSNLDRRRIEAPIIYVDQCAVILIYSFEVLFTHCKLPLGFDWVLHNQ